MRHDAKARTMTFPNQLALISPADLQKLVEDSMRKVMAEKSGAAPVVTVGVADAADCLGISKRKFYDLLKEHPDLDRASFHIGKRRLWRVAALEEWIKRQEGRPAVQEAA
jgi:predicted DNA-binding transcriptional regulator AlpA